MGEPERRQLLFVGKINVDVTANVPYVTALEDAKYSATGGTSVSLGGAPANAVRAVKVLEDAFEDPCPTKIVTCIGQRPRREAYRDNYGEFLAAKHAYEMALELLVDEGINYTDVTAGQEGIGMPLNLVGNYRGGRTILKQTPRPLSEGFAASVDGIVSAARQIMSVEMVGSSYVFVDPTRSVLGAFAAEACVEAGVPLVVDYGEKTWPEDPQKAYRVGAILKNADILIVPSDAVVEGMEDNVKDPDRLFEILSGDQYKANTIIMSDGTQPVQLYHDGRHIEIEVVPHDGPIYANSVGDTRDAALMFFLSRGDEMEMAVRKATSIASLKVQYPNSDWRYRQQREC